MDQTTTTVSAKKGLPILGKDKVAKSEEELERELSFFVASERERLGIKEERKQWVDTMLDPQMSKKERDHVTLLISGLTAAQDFLCEGALKGLGYNVEYMGMSDNAGL